MQLEAITCVDREKSSLSPVSGLLSTASPFDSSITIDSLYLSFFVSNGNSFGYMSYEHLPWFCLTPRELPYGKIFNLPILFTCLVLMICLLLMFRQLRTKEMPRKPIRLRQLSKIQPPTFSPFGRSVARATSTYNAKRLAHCSELNNKCFPSSQGDRVGHEHPLENGSDHSQSSDDEESDGVIEADFAFFDPKPEDFHGVKVLLKTYLDNKQWDLSGFVDLILEQTTVGTVIKIEGDEDDTPYSVISALNLKRYKDHRCMKEIREFLIKQCSDKNVLANMSSLWIEQSQNVGLLVSQRVVNLPPQLLPPLYDGLFEEITWATEDEPTEALRKSFCFQHYLLVTRIYELKNATQNLKGASSSSEEPIIYIKPEDELFHKLSLWFFKFPLETQQLPTHELRNYRLMGLVMTVEADKIQKFRQQLHSLIDES